MPAWINNYGREDVLLGLPMAFFVAILVIIVAATNPSMSLS